jgi:retron-type reverse transcriptase
MCRIVNHSLATGQFPSDLRKAIITPILKKPSLDRQLLKSYRPVSNLPFLGKLIERVASSQVATFVDSNSLGEPLQSAYRRAHSTETALLAVQDFFLRAIDDKKAVLLVMIDMSAAFDTVDHNILLQRLTDDFGIRGSVHLWFQTYLRNRTSQVNVSGSASAETQLKYGVPQGSVIGPQVFVYYSHTIGQIIRKHSIQYHIYADDVQLYLSVDPTIPGDSACALFKLARCVKELQAWMVSNKLMMNPEKN